MNNLKGVLVEIYLRSGKVLRGTIMRFSKDGLEMKAVDGDLVYVPSLDCIEAMKYNMNGNEPLKEKDPDSCKPPENKVSDIKSLVKLKQMKAREVLDGIRKKMNSENIETENTGYGDLLSLLRTTSIDTKKQDLHLEEQDN